MASKSSPSLQQSEGFARRDRPFLLPYNRKLRNLVSISLRNLSIAQAGTSRKRGKTIDDDALPNTLKSPAKIVALREHKALGHSRSSSDLQRVAEDAVADQSDKETARSNKKSTKEDNDKSTAPSTPSRPPIRKMRRRSTLEWANASPQTRQEKWESVTAERVADVFFSLHVEGLDEPVYISETVPETMNPTFRHIDFSRCGPGITRLDKIALRFWAKNVKTGRWIQLLERSFDLSTLQYLGKNLDHFDRPLPQNAILFHLTDGVYTSFDSVSDLILPPLAAPTRSASARVLLTSSFDVILRLAKLDDSIQDALAARDKIAADLENLLEANDKALSDHDKVAEAEDRLKTIEYAKKTVEKQLEKARKQQSEKRASLKARRELMIADVEFQTTSRSDMESSRPEFPAFRDEHDVKRKAIENQRRRVCEDLQTCFAIEPVPKQSLAFTIRGLHLPNADELDKETPEIISAALGHVAHALLLLSLYLRQPLPYPVTPRSSTSTIYDPISLLKTNSSTTHTYKDERVLRTYPLFMKGVPRFRFEYGVFLLNKNIQVLFECAFNTRVVEIRQTLPNLKYLLYVATAGEGELPARKAGGIRGLLRGRNDGDTASTERDHSQDSTGSTFSGRFWSSNAANGRPKGAVDSLRKTMDGKARKH